MKNSILRWTIALSMLLSSFVSVSALTSHVPGVFTKSTTEGGWGLTNYTYSGNQYEMFWFSKKVAGTSGSYFLASNLSNVYSINNNQSAYSWSGDWYSISVDGMSSQGAISGANEFNTTYLDAANSVQPTYLKLKSGNTITFQVKGYDQVAFYAKDNGTSKNKWLNISINGSVVKSAGVSDYQYLSYNLDETKDNVVSISTEGTSASSFVAFSLRCVPIPITALSIAGVAADYVSIDSIHVTVPYSTDLSSVVPTFTLNPLASFVNASDQTAAQNFSSPVTYSLMCSGKSRSVKVVVDKIAASSVCKLSTFSAEINGEVRQGTIDETNKTIALKLPYSYKTDVTKKSAIKTNFTFEDDKATANLTSGDNQNYSSSNTIPDFITITAQNGTTKRAYTLNLDYEAAETGKSILSFDLAGGQTIISEADKTIKVTVSGSTNIKNIAPTITVSSMATASPASGVAQDFTNPVAYTVTAEDGTTQTYTVTVVQDASLPKITKITPADNATGVSLGGTVSIEFDKNVVLGSGNVTMVETATPSKSFSLTPNTIPTEGTTTVTLPFSGLSGLTKYTLSVPTGSFVDLYGNKVDLKSITFTTADGTLHTADLPYASKMDGSNFAQPAFIIGGTYDATADTKAATTTQYGAYKLAAGENMTLTAGSAGTVDVVFYSRSTGSYSISSLATTNVTTGTIDHYTNKGVENSLTIDSSNTSTVTITNTGTTDLYVAYISVSKVGEAAITEQAANCK